MSRIPSIAMCMSLGVLAASVAASAHADAPAPGQSAASKSVSTSITREKRVGTRLETILVTAGAVDRHNQRFADSRAATAVLPTVPESAFLEDDDADSVESR